MPPSNSGIKLENRGYPNSWAIGAVGTRVSDHLFAVATHDGKSLVPGVQIIWTVSGSGGSISPTTDTTKAGLLSVARLTLGPDEGKYTVTATAPTIPGTPSVTFQATAVTVMVQMRDLVDGGFVPASVTVPSGRSVGWRYDRYDCGECNVHNVTFEDDPTRPVSSVDLYDIIGGARRHHSRLFDGAPRTIRYRCTHHSSGFVEGEVGTVTVQ